MQAALEANKTYIVTTDAAEMTNDDDTRDAANGC